MNYTIVSKSSLPNNIQSNYSTKQVLCVYDNSGLVRQIISGTSGSLCSKVDAAGGRLSPGSVSALDFSNIKTGGVKESMSNSNIVESAKGLIDGNFAGLFNFNLQEFWVHVKGAAQRTISKNKSSAKSAARLRIGEITLNRVVDYLFKSTESAIPGIKIPFLKKKSFIDLEKHREIISIVVGNVSLLGLDIFSYFGIPLTGSGEFVAQCMTEYAYDLASKKIAAYLPQTKIVSGISAIINGVEKEVGKETLQQAMTDNEKAAMADSDPNSLKNELGNILGNKGVEGQTDGHRPDGPPNQ